MSEKQMSEQKVFIALCYSCKHIWKAGLPDGLDPGQELECPECHKMTGQIFGMAEHSIKDIRADERRKVLDEVEKEILASFGLQDQFKRGHNLTVIKIGEILEKMRGKT